MIGEVLSRRPISGQQSETVLLQPGNNFIAKQLW